VGEREGETMSALKDTETAASKFDDKLHKLIKRAKKQRGMLWPSVVSKLELARAGVNRWSRSALWAEMTMIKTTKFLRKQAEKAERQARAAPDEEVAQNLSNLAKTYRSQANVLKK